MTNPETPAPAPLGASVLHFAGGATIAIVSATGQALDRWTFAGDDVAGQLATRGYLADGPEVMALSNLGVILLASCATCGTALPPSAAGGDGRCAMC